TSGPISPQRRGDRVKGHPGGARIQQRKTQTTMIFSRLRFFQLFAGAFLAVVFSPGLSAQGVDSAAREGLDQVVTGLNRPVLAAPANGTGFPAIESYEQPTLSYSRTLRDEGTVAGAVARAWLEMFDDRSYLKL